MYYRYVTRMATTVRVRWQLLIVMMQIMSIISIIVNIFISVYIYIYLYIYIYIYICAQVLSTTSNLNSCFDLSIFRVVALNIDLIRPIWLLSFTLLCNQKRNAHRILLRLDNATAGNGMQRPYCCGTGIRPQQVKGQDRCGSTLCRCHLAKHLLWCYLCDQLDQDVGSDCRHNGQGSQAFQRHVRSCHLVFFPRNIGTEPHSHNDDLQRPSATTAASTCPSTARESGSNR